MKKTSKTLIFFGNERLVSGLKTTEAPILSELLRQGYAVKAIVSHHGDTRSRTARPLEVASLAKKHSIPLFTPKNPFDILGQLAGLKADAAILAAYGQIIPQKIIDLFPLGIINIHPSLLPKYRGPTPIEAAILSGDKISGVSIMQLTSKMDAGPIYAQQEFSIKPDNTKFDIYEKAAHLSAELLLKTLPSILDGSLQPTPQDESRATYCSLLSKNDGILSPSQISAVEAERRVRAFLGFPKAKLIINNQTLIVTKAHVVAQKETLLDVKFNDGKYLSIDQLIAPSGKKMGKKDFLHGYIKPEV